MRVTDLKKVGELEDTDYVVVENNYPEDYETTFKMSLTNLPYAMGVKPLTDHIYTSYIYRDDPYQPYDDWDVDNQMPTYTRNTVFRGKSLGTAIDDIQKTNIAMGLFHDMYIGDYWDLTYAGETIRWRIAAFEYGRLHYYAQDIPGTHWLGLMPDTAKFFSGSSSFAVTDAFAAKLNTYCNDLWGTTVAGLFSDILMYRPVRECTAFPNSYPTVNVVYRSMQIPSAAMLGLKDDQLAHYGNSSGYPSFSRGAVGDNTPLPLMRLAPYYAKPRYTNGENFKILLNDFWGNRLFFTWRSGTEVGQVATNYNRSSTAIRPIVWIAGKIPE